MCVCGKGTYMNQRSVWILGFIQGNQKGYCKLEYSCIMYTDDDLCAQPQSFRGGFGSRNQSLNFKTFKTFVYI